MTVDEREAIRAAVGGETTCACGDVYPRSEMVADPDGGYACQTCAYMEGIVPGEPGPSVPFDFGEPGEEAKDTKDASFVSSATPLVKAYRPEDHLPVYGPAEARRINASLAAIRRATHAGPKRKRK